MAPVRLSPSSYYPSQVSWVSLAVASSARNIAEALTLCAIAIGVCARRWGAWSAAITAVVTLLFSGPTAAYAASPDASCNAGEPSSAAAEVEHGPLLDQWLATELAFEQSTVAEENDPLVAKKLLAAPSSHLRLGFRAGERSARHGRFRDTFGFAEATQAEHAPRGPPAL